MDFARNVLDRLRSKVHLITLLVASCAGRNLSRQSKVHMFPRPVEAHKTDQMLVPVHGVLQTRNLTLPSTNPKTAKRRRARRDHQMILHAKQDQEDAHMILHMARPQMTLLRGVKQSPKNAALLTGDPCRLRSQVHLRCQIRVNVPNHLRNQRIRQMSCRSLRRCDHLNSPTFQLRIVCANAEPWNL